MTRCSWYKGYCDQPDEPDLDGLCAFHFDACERKDHADAQAAHDATFTTPEPALFAAQDDDA